MFLPVITKFSNFVIFRRWDGWWMKNFWNYAGSLKIPIYREGLRKKQYIGRNCLKRGGLKQFVDLMQGGGVGDLVENRAGVFLREEVDTSMHTMKLAVTLTVILIYWC